MATERDFPRAVVALQVEIAGATELLDVVVVPRRVSVTRRAHTQADTADIEIDGTEVPFDARAVRSIVATVHMGGARSALDTTWKSAASRRFVGFADTFENEQEEDDTITLKARDLSALFRDTKPLPPKAVPRYSDTLGEAIRRIVDNVPGAPALTLDMPEGDVPLRNLVHERVSGADIHLERDMTAWAVIEYIAGLADRLVSVHLDTLLIRSPRSAYDHQAQPKAALEFNTANANVMKLKVLKKFTRNRKGIRVVGWDPIGRKRIEADYPPDSELPTTARPVAPSTRRRRTAAPQPPERDVYPAGGVQTEEALMRVAQGIWLERSRQELSIDTDTPYYSERMLSLMNGDRVRLQLNRLIVAGINRDQPKAAQIAYVQRRLQVSRRAAEVLLSTAEHPGSDLFYVHEATLQWHPDGECGVRLELINLIAVEAPNA